MFAGRYKVGRCIASGGMGAVHEVEHVETGRRAALKVMLPHVLMGDGARAQFKAEARVAAKLRSEHVVDVLDAGVDEATDMPYLVMELLEGEDLGARLRRLGPLPAEDVIVYLAQVARALDRVHRGGIVHRDLKPENLFLTARDDGTPLVKVLDFGIAKILSDGATSAVTVEARGTPIYMSPEQFTHEMKISAATDIYALGMVAFTLLAGGAYWAPELAQGMNVFLIARLAEAGPQQPASVRARDRGVEIPPGFDKWFMKATCSDPKGRFTDAIEALEALALAIGMDLPPRTERERISLLGPESTPPRSARAASTPPRVTPERDVRRSLSREVDPSRLQERSSLPREERPSSARNVEDHVPPVAAARGDRLAPPASHRRTSDPYSAFGDDALGTPRNCRASTPPADFTPDRVSSPYTEPEVIARRTLPRAERNARLPAAPVDRPAAVAARPPADVHAAGPADSDILLSSTRDSDSENASQGTGDGLDKGAVGEGLSGRRASRLLRRVRWIAPAVAVGGLLLLGSLWLRKVSVGSSRDVNGAVSEQPFPPGRARQDGAVTPQILVAPALTGTIAATGTDAPMGTMGATGTDAPMGTIAPTGTLSPSTVTIVAAPGGAAPGAAPKDSGPVASARKPAPGPAATTPAAPPASASVKKPRYTQD